MPAVKKTDSFAELVADQIDTATQMPASGVAAGSYTLASITVDAKGLVTSASSGSVSVPVTSVAGKTGAVTLVASDVGSVPSGVLKGSGGAFAAAAAGTDYAAAGVNNTGQYGFGTSTLGAAAKITVNPNVVTDPLAAVQINAGSDTGHCLVLQRNSAGSTGNILEVQSQTGSVLTRVTKDGRLNYGVTNGTLGGVVVSATGPTDNNGVYTTIDAFGTDTGYTGVTGNVRILISAASSAITGVLASVSTSGGTGLLQGGIYASRNTVTTSFGTGGRTTAAFGSSSRLTNTSGTVDNWYAFYVDTISNSATLTNAYGLYVTDVTAASTGNYAIYTNAGKVSLGGLLHCRSGFASPVAAKTSAYTLTTSDGTVTCNATTAAFAVTLPAATAQSGVRFTVKKTDSSANAVTLTAAGTDKIDGAATYVLGSQYKYVTVQSDGSANWWVIANN